jgi:hypothetical protein
MHLTRSPRSFALAAIAATFALGLPQATAQAAVPGPHALAAPARTVPGPATDGHAWPRWVRAAVATAASHQARPAITIGDFKACPKLPAGFDPSQFSCFLTHITGGLLQIGHANQVINADITVAYAEGSAPSGDTVIVFGSLKSAPMPVSGGIFLTPAVDTVTQTDPNLRLSVQPVGLGVKIDPTGFGAGFISMKVKAVNPVFGNTCFVGSNSSAVTVDPTFGTTDPPAPNQPISGHVDSSQFNGTELVIIGTMVDNSFSAPGAQGCGPGGALSPVVNEVGALPSKAGRNTAIFQSTIEVVTYTNITS